MAGRSDECFVLIRQAIGPVTERWHTPGGFMSAIDRPITESVQLLQNLTVPGSQLLLAVKDARIGAGPEA